MISYDGGSWTDILRRWHGSVLESCLPKVSIVFAYVLVSYTLQALLDCNFGAAFKQSYIVGRSLSFLLVFRANSSYEKYWEGRHHCAEFFASLRNLAMLCCALFKGGHGQHIWNRRHGADGFSEERRASCDDFHDGRASEARADIVRWSLALAIAFRICMHLTVVQQRVGELDVSNKWRLNFARMRLRTLLSKEEFMEIDKALKVEDSGEEHRLLWSNPSSGPHVFHKQGPPSMPGGKYRVLTEPSYSQVTVILNFIAQSCRLHANEPYGYKERFLPSFIGIITHINSLNDRVHQAMTCLLPLPYVNLVRTLLLTYLFSLPFFVSYEDGLIANVIMPSFSALALLGIDQIGNELENPFGDDVNDLDFEAMIMSLEKELLRTLEIAGDTRARDKFTWLPVPKFMQNESDKPFLWYVALRREVCHLDVPRARATGGLRVRHVDLELPRLGASRPAAARPLGR